MNIKTEWHGVYLLPETDEEKEKLKDLFKNAKYTQQYEYGDLEWDEDGSLYIGR